LVGIPSHPSKLELFVCHAILVNAVDLPAFGGYLNKVRMNRQRKFNTIA
jgi:hypothetical protein